MKQSKCIYCNSEEHGEGCKESPNKCHIHTDTDNRCVYCGTIDESNNCSLSPTKQHLYKKDYDSKLNESIKNTFAVAYLMSEISKNIEDTRLYKNGLINESGDIIRSKDDRGNQISPIDVYILLLKKFLGPKAQLLNNEAALKYAVNLSINTSPFLYNKEIEFKNKIENIAKQLKETVEEAHIDGLSILTIENILFENFSKTS